MLTCTSNDECTGQGTDCTGIQLFARGIAMAEKSISGKMYEVVCFPLSVRKGVTGDGNSIFFPDDALFSFSRIPLSNCKDAQNVDWLLLVDVGLTALLEDDVVDDSWNPNSWNVNPGWSAPKETKKSLLANQEVDQKIADCSSTK